MSEEKTEKGISKEHAEQIWEAVLESAKKPSVYSPSCVVAELIDVRLQLDKAIKLPEKEALRRTIFDGAWAGKYDHSTAVNAVSKIDAAEKKNDSITHESPYCLIPKDAFHGFTRKVD